MDKMRFRCAYCGMSFGRNVVGLARHIGREHASGQRKHQ